MVKIPCFLNSNENYLGSKSCSTPVRLFFSPSFLPLVTQLTANVQIVAAIYSLLNDYLISEGKCLLSFLNP